MLPFLLPDLSVRPPAETGTFPGIEVHHPVYWTGRRPARGRRETLRKFWIFLFLGMFLLSACGGGGTSPLVGKWSDPSGQAIFDFRADGKLSMTAGEITVEAGTYQVLSPGILELDIQGQKQRLAYTIVGDRLTLTDEAGVSLELVRVK